MNIEMSRKAFYEVMKKLFSEISEDENSLVIPLFSDHQIYINEVMIFLEKDKRNWFFINSYGQLMIQQENDGHKRNIIHFNLKNLKSISFLARNIYGSLNENGEPYNEMYRIKLQ